VTVSRSVGGVLSTGPLRESGWVTIHLCGLPGSVCGRVALSLFGLAPDGVCRADRVAPAAGALLPHRFTLTCARNPEGFMAIGGLFSVALSCGSPRLAASQHPSLWSPDLPQRVPRMGEAPRSPGRLTVSSSVAEDSARSNGDSVRPFPEGTRVHGKTGFMRILGSRKNWAREKFGLATTVRPD